MPISVPAVKDTTPCMEQMLDYEDCVFDSGINYNIEVVHPNWPTVFPGLLTDGQTDNLLAYGSTPRQVNNNRPLNKKDKQFLWECEQERFVYKSCLRKVIGLNRSSKHTSWNVAEVSNLSFI